MLVTFKVVMHLSVFLRRSLARARFRVVNEEPGLSDEVVMIFVDSEVIDREVREFYPRDGVFAVRYPLSPLIVEIRRKGS